ncbi:MAG: AAA family ATPase [Anaerolineae bacterium]|nr:MAG: AAA family ATPase [Anaerolineae bacterium]
MAYTKRRPFTLTFQALEELASEIRAAGVSPAPALPTLESVLAELDTLPPQAVFLGVATDGLPLLLNLTDPSPGPLLVLGDAGCGKTAFLQTIVHAITLTDTAQHVQFAVITNYPEEWEGYDALPNSNGIYATYHPDSEEFLTHLFEWTHGNRGTRQSVLLLLDDLESLTHTSQETRQHLRYLLLRGPTRHVWPIATMNARRSNLIAPWLEAFRTRIFGHVRNAVLAERLTGDRKANLSTLLAGVQFTLRQGIDWLRFWIPRLDGEEAPEE